MFSTIWSMQSITSAIIKEAISTMIALLTSWVLVGQEVLYRSSV